MFFKEYFNQFVATAITIVVFVVLRYLINKVINKVDQQANIGNSRKGLVRKYIDYLAFALSLIIIVSIWGIKPEQLFLFVSSVLTVIGVAFFAQWSILSNVTAGIILFFSFPFKIGDKIRLLDKDFPIEARIVEIQSFYTLLRTEQGEEISIPNNLLLQKGVEILSKG